MTAPTTELTGAALLREAARQMRERAEAATPGPWRRPLDVRHKAVVTAPKPENEPGQWTDGRPEEVGVVQLNLWSDGTFFRKRGGRDLEHIASWHPAVALAVSEWLGEQADAWDLAFGVTQLPSRGVDEPPAVHFGDPEAARLGADYHARRALAVARAYLGLS